MDSGTFTSFNISTAVSTIRGNDIGVDISVRRLDSFATDTAHGRNMDSSNDGFKITTNDVYKIMLDICSLLFDNFKTG